MDKELFSRRLEELRKAKGYSSQYKLAEAYELMFPTKRKVESDGNTGYGGILGTIKHYENPNYKESSPTLEKVDNICTLLECDIDYLTGRIDYQSHDLQFICQYTGLSPQAVELLHYLTFDMQPQYKNVSTHNMLIIDLINRVLESSYPYMDIDSDGRAAYITNLFTLIEQYLQPVISNEMKKTVKAMGVNGSQQETVYSDSELKLLQIQRELIRLHNSTAATVTLPKQVEGFDTPDSFNSWRNNLLKQMEE